MPRIPRETSIVIAKNISVFCIPILVFLAMAGVLTERTAGAAGPGPVGLGTAADFAVLGGSTVTNTGETVVTGDLGLSPGTSITGFPPGTVNGTIHQTDAVALQAQKDLTTAYDDAAGRTSTATISADLEGRTLTPGVYQGAPSLQLTGTLTLDGQGDANAVFIFRAPASTLTTASGSRVVLIGGAQACNLIWQIGSSATLGSGSFFKGNILALRSITMNTGTTVDGSALARNGAVTLDDNTISRAPCSGGPATATTGPDGGTTATTTPSGGTTGPTVPGDTTASTKPGSGTTGRTNPRSGRTGSTTLDGGATATIPPGGGATPTMGSRLPAASTDADGGIMTDTDARPPLARTGAGHSRGVALSGLALAGLGLMIMRIARRPTVS